MATPNDYFNSHQISARDFMVDGIWTRGQLLESRLDERSMNAWYEYGLPGGELRYIVSSRLGTEEEFDAKGFNLFLQGKGSEFKTLTNLRK